MSEQLVKIGLTCAVIVLGAGVLGSQLSNSPGLMQSAISDSEESADQAEPSKKASVTEADEEAEDDTEEDVAAENSDEAEVDADEVASEESPGGSEGDVNQPEETAQDSAESEATDTDSGQDDDGNVVYNGIPAGTVTEDE
jgi:hypothetical protein